MRAVVASPNFFSPQKTGHRWLADGGMEFNNASHAIFEHYSSTDTHGNLDSLKFQYINIGSGTDGVPDPAALKVHLWDFLLPRAIRSYRPGTKRLNSISDFSERTANIMNTIACVMGPTTNRLRIKYNRFSANNGVHLVRFDSYKEIEKVRTLTLSYLEAETSASRLRMVAKEIATTYLQKRDRATVPTT
jgi:hypothetical protein